MQSLITLLTSLEGRIGRAQFWLGAVILLVISAVLGFGAIALGLGETSVITGQASINGGPSSDYSRIITRLNPWVGLVIATATSYFWVALCMKRRHDRAFNGYDVVAYAAITLLLQLLGVFGMQSQFLGMVSIGMAVWTVCLLILLGFLKGTPGANKYGPDPLAAQE